MQKQSDQNLAYVVFLAVVAALGGFLFGYDAAVISGTIAQVSKQFQLDAISQGWYVGCALAGSIAGVAVAGILSDYFGRKKAMIASAILFSISGLGCAIAADFNTLVIYRIIGGVGIGVVSIISPLYISEVSITQYRGRLVALYQLAITVGFSGAYLVNFQLQEAAVNLHFGNVLMQKIFVSEVWRSMLGMEALPAILFFMIIFFIPESPRWLIVKRKEPNALRVLSRIYRNQTEAVTQIDAVKQQLNKEAQTDWKLLLQPAYGKALLFGVAIAILGQFMGVNAVLYYGPTIFTNSGLSAGDSLFYQVLVGLVNVGATIIALAIIDRAGRKKLVYYGVSGMIASLVMIGLYFTIGTAWSSLFLLVFFLLYIFSCAISICAVIWVLLSEMYPTRVRGIAMSVAGFALWVGTYLIGQCTPWMLSHLTPAGTFFFFAVMCVPYIWIVWKKIPETTGRSLEEIERMWV